MIPKSGPLLFFFLMSSLPSGPAAADSYVDIIVKDNSRYILEISEFGNSGAYRETMVISLGPLCSTESGLPYATPWNEPPLIIIDFRTAAARYHPPDCARCG